MTQITLEKLKIFLQINSFKLQPTQKKLCFPIIQRIHHKMNIGVQFENINVDKELLINGHHRYVCSLLSNRKVNINPWQSPSKAVVFSWPSIEIDEKDWESQELIDRHNIADATKSGLTINDFKI